MTIRRLRFHPPNVVLTTATGQPKMAQDKVRGSVGQILAFAKALKQRKEQPNN
jgi:hypothetical protein